MQAIILSTIIVTGTCAASLVALGAGLIPAIVIGAAVTVPVALIAELMAACFE